MVIFRSKMHAFSSTCSSTWLHTGKTYSIVKVLIACREKVSACRVCATVGNAVWSRLGPFGVGPFGVGPRQVVVYLNNSLQQNQFSSIRCPILVLKPSL